MRTNRLFEEELKDENDNNCSGVGLLLLLLFYREVGFRRKDDC